MKSFHTWESDSLLDKQNSTYVNFHYTELWFLTVLSDAHQTCLDKFPPSTFPNICIFIRTRYQQSFCWSKHFKSILDILDTLYCFGKNTLKKKSLHNSENVNILLCVWERVEWMSECECFWHYPYGKLFIYFSI